MKRYDFMNEKCASDNIDDDCLPFALNSLQQKAHLFDVFGMLWKRRSCVNLKIVFINFSTFWLATKIFATKIDE